MALRRQSIENKNVERALSNIFLVATLLTAMFCSCRKTAPQAPANRAHDDNAAVAMALINMRLAEEADRQCTEYVKRSGRAFVLEDSGCWLCWNKRAENSLLTNGDKVSLLVEITTLDSVQLDNTDLQLEVGKTDLLPCFNYLLPLLHQGDEVTAIVPYYLAYGKDGNGSVPPLTNCLITITEITVENTITDN